MSHQELNALLDDAFWEGDSRQIINLFHEKSEDQYLEIVAEKIKSLNSCIVSLDQNEDIVKNILKILTDVIPILKNNEVQSYVIAECMLKIATEERVPVNILRCAVYNLNSLLNGNGPTLIWLKNSELLEGYLLILGRKLPIVGDFECQSHIFETLCYIICDNENKHKWIQSWFPDDEKTRSMLLNWDMDSFNVESRKILNQINRRELNPRTYAFAATAVYFGDVQLKKLDGLEFWIDFNYDSESISFFCKDLEPEGDYWETVVIPSENVESYSVQKKEDIKSIELCITLNCPCKDLLVSSSPLFESTNLVRMTFWIYVDISSHLRMIFGEPLTLANNLAVNSQGSQRTRKVSMSVDSFGVQDLVGSKKTQKVSLSVDAFAVRDQDDTAAVRNIRKISNSDALKIQAEDYYEKKGRRYSDSAELVCPSDDASNFHITNTVHKSHDTSQKRKVSSCSLFLKESDSERSYEMNGKNKHARFKFVRSVSTNKHSRSNEKLIKEEDERDANKHCQKESSSEIFRSERKSSDSYCAIDYRSDDSNILIIDTDDGEEGRFEKIPENLLKEIHEIPLEKHSASLQTTSEGFLENTNSKTEKVSRFKFQKFVPDVGIDKSVSNDLSKKSLQSIETETGLSLRNSHIIRNSNESAKLSQKEKRSISPEGSQNSQKRIKVDGSIKVSQSFSDEAYVISPTPASRKKSRKTAMLTPNKLKDHNSSEAQYSFTNHADATEYEKSISHKTTVDEDIEDLKNSNSSQTKNFKDGTPNNRQKKMRLYNINCDSVFDVPPSEQRKVNTTPILKNFFPFVDLSPKNQKTSILLSSLPLNDEDFCETNKFCKQSTDSLEFKKKLNIIYEASDENKLTESKFLEMGQIKDQVTKSSKQDTSESDLHLSDKDATSSEPRKKRLKKNSDEVDQRKSSTSRLSKRKPNYVDKEVTSDETPPKKQRKAAIKARKKNKTLLEHKESGYTTEVFSEKSDNINHSNDDVSEVFCTPPTKPVKKRRLKSVFLTDTETGSSNVSWIGGQNSCLFETPEKRYSKRMKSKQSFESPSPKKKTYKSTVGNSKKKRNSKISMKGFEIKSKNGISDLENYKLIVERKTDHKKPSNSHHKHFTFEDISKAVNVAKEKMDKQYFDDKFDKELNISNIESGMYDNSHAFDYDGELHTNELEVKEDFNTSERNQINISGIDFKSILTEEQNMVKMMPKLSASKERQTDQSFFCEKDSSSIPERHQKSVSNDLPLSNAKKRKSASSLKKRKPDNLSTSKEKVQRNRQNSNNPQGIISDLVTHTNDDFDAQDSIALDETSSNVPPALVAQFPKSPNISENDKSSFSSMREKATETRFHHTCLSPKIGILTEQSLSSLASENDEVASKDLQMKRFLKDLPDFNSLKNFECSDNLDQAITSQSNEKSKSNKSSRSGNLLEHSATKKHCSKEARNSELSSAQKYIDIKKKKFPVLHILGNATDNLTFALLNTLQRHFYNFKVKIATSREKMLETASALISKENDWNHKDLKDLAKTYKMQRIQAEKSLSEILLVGKEYFEAEKKLDHKMKRLHKKALKKYAARMKIAGRYAVEALEDRAAAKTDVHFKSILKKIEHL